MSKKNYLKHEYRQKKLDKKYIACSIVTIVCYSLLVVGSSVLGAWVIYLHSRGI